MAEAAPLDDEEMAAWRAFVWVATRALDRLDHELSAAHGLSLADYEILAGLSEAPQRRIQMTELAALAQLSQSRLTYRIDRLERQDLVVRMPCDSDGRRVWASLTDAGFARLVEAYPTHVAGARRYVIDPVHRDQLANLTSALQAMRSALDEQCRELRAQVPDAGCADAG
jgi:DNA-binding MarR family transcriptional regulator